VVPTDDAKVIITYPDKSGMKNSPRSGNYLDIAETHDQDCSLTPFTQLAHP
jgi:hypothetical protein